MSWHYTLRSVDGHIAQHVKAKDVGWHAGNWYVNAKAIGLEHEGFAAQGTWYTEAMYRTSAKLVRHLALRHGHPAGPPAHHRPRQRARHHPGHGARHALGPGPVLGLVALLRPAAARRSGGTGDAAHRPGHDQPRLRHQPARVHRLRHGRRQPVPVARLVVGDPAHARRAPTPRCSTTSGCARTARRARCTISDHGARASAGQKFAIAERRGRLDRDLVPGPEGLVPQPAAPRRPRVGRSVSWSTPKAGKATIPGVRPGLPGAGRLPGRRARTRRSRRCSTRSRPASGTRSGTVLAGEYYRATHVRRDVTGRRTVIRGETKYVQIQFGHRIMYVNLDDVQILPS